MHGRRPPNRAPWPLVIACLVPFLGWALSGCSASSAPTKSEATLQIAPGHTAIVPYCNGETAKITEPRRAGAPAPAAIYLHGGSWVGGDFDTGGFLIDRIGPALNARGFVTVAVDYRLGPRERWPAQIVDAKCAVRFLRANAEALRVDPNEIGVWGHSAGGHLAALVGTAPPSAGWDTGADALESSRVEAVVDLAGPSDLTSLGGAGYPGAVQRNFISLLGPASPTQIAAELSKASPITYVSRGDPPFLVVHADDDPIVPFAQSVGLVRALRGAGVPTTLVTVHGGGHSLASAGGLPDPSAIVAIVVRFFTDELEPSGS